MSLQTFEHLKHIVDPLLEYYKEDLHKHDYNMLKQFDVPFVYGYRRTGTNLLFMNPSIEDYWKVPQPLAEMATDLKDSFMWIDHPNRNTHFLHFDGNKLIKKSAKELKVIWMNHVDKIVRVAREKLSYQHQRTHRGIGTWAYA